MSDVEIIEAMRLSDLTLFASPTGVLSIIAHYSRPNVYSFRLGAGIEVTAYHLQSEEHIIYNRPIPDEISNICHIIGTVGDIIYFQGMKRGMDYILFTFDISTHVSTYKGRIDGTLSPSVSPTGQIYLCGGFDGAFHKLDLITMVKTELPDMIVPRIDCKSFFHNGSIYTIGGLDTSYGDIADCERFDIERNKWYTIASLPVPSRVMTLVEKDGSLIAVTMKKQVFVYDPEKDEWQILKWDKDFTKLELGTLQYYRGKFYAVSEEDRENPTAVVWESSSPETPWNTILKLKKHFRSKVNAYLNLTEEQVPL